VGKKRERRSAWNALTLAQVQKSREPNRYKVGLALCGGVAYGVSQLGVLRVLEKAGIHVDCLAGTSSGSIVAAAYAAGMSLSEMEEFGLRTTWKELFKISLSKTGLVSSVPIQNYIRRHLKVDRFEQLKKPLAVVATDLCTEEEVVFTRGPLDLAVRASCSIPGIYVPVETEGRQLVDGGMAENVPVAALKALGADVVIAVNVFGEAGVIPPATNVLQIFMRTWNTFVRDQTAWREKADVVIEPDLKRFDLFDFTKAPAILAEGDKAARAAMPRLKRILQRRFFFRPEIYR
jgi:NTE family protein